MSTLCFLFFLIWTVICYVQAGRLGEGDVCAPDGSKCTNLKNCTILHDEANRGKKPLLCGIKGKDIITCCSKDRLHMFSQALNSISYDACRWYNDEICKEVIANSLPQEEGKFSRSFFEEKTPFLALIGYCPEKRRTWRCGGVLISRKYVLAPAHCSSHSNLGPAMWVGFRNDDITNTSNIYKITNRFNHPDYHYPVKYNDIALYQLDRLVQFSYLVRPICLPQNYAEYEHVINVHSAGWIIKNKKPQALGNTVKVIPSGSCAFAGTSQEIPDGTDGQDILCVNGYDSGSPTRCRNNFFGGALFTSNYDDCDSGTLLGLLSIGKLCNDMDFTGVYTNITHFMPWIESIVWPENSTYAETVWNH